MSRSRLFKGVLVITALALAGGSFAFAGTDSHLQDQAAPIVLKSAFAHGYLHGYDVGYHIGDQDFQVGHVREAKDIREAKSPSVKDSRPTFRAGYEEGFLAGYDDSVSGRDFQGVSALRWVAQGNEVAMDASFDLGMEQGYAAGHSRGMEDQVSDADFDAIATSCPVTQTGGPARSYCEAYARAYTLGYRDGYLAERQEAATQVAARK